MMSLGRFMFDVMTLDRRNYNGYFEFPVVLDMKEFMEHNQDQLRLNEEDQKILKMEYNEYEKKESYDRENMNSMFEQKKCQKRKQQQRWIWIVVEKFMNDIDLDVSVPDDIKGLCVEYCKNIRINRLDRDCYEYNKESEYLYLLCGVMGYIGDVKEGNYYVCLRDMDDINNIGDNLILDDNDNDNGLIIMENGIVVITLSYQ